ncbi:MAG TPA: phosphoesterase, partial [Thermoanaerobaculia bacterium]|nr:phosphoesterase [Thermoanaerobaculia bacterium]
DSRLYVAENVRGTLAVLELPGGRVLQRLPAGRYPYAVAVAPKGEVYVSSWGGDAVAVFAPAPRPAPAGTLRARAPIAAGRHPSALALAASGSRLFVASASTDSIAVLDPVRGRLLATLRDPAPTGPREGSTPNALALSPDGTRLYVAEADANAVAVFELSARTAGTPKARGRDRLAGRIPVGWYPTGVLAGADGLRVLNGKGRGAGPNPEMVQPLDKLLPDSTGYTLGQLRGTLTTLPASLLADLAPLTRRVVGANGWDRPRTAKRYPPFRHVLYIIKENRTYDQVLGDLSQGDGDPSLLFFPREISPNHHALAERFGLFDRFFVNAEVSAQGHNWSTAAYVTDYTEKTTPSAYSDRRDEVDEGETDEPASGYLWILALRKALGVRIYGELAEKDPGSPAGAPRYRSTKRALRPYTSPTYPPYDLAISDQVRADAWLREFQEFVAKGEMPALQIFHLPNDHTAGARPGRPTPRAFMADNDLALGRIVEAVSRSPFWKDTVIFALEDDAQAGPDHVDSHRSVLLAVSAYNRPGTFHRFVNTTDVLATVEEILGLDTLSQFDHFGRPLRELFAAKPDLTPYAALPAGVPWSEVNPPGTPAGAATARLNLDTVDAADDDLFNRVLWRTIKGEAVPYPAPRVIPLREIVLGR